MSQLIYTLYGPMASWAERNRGAERRPTEMVPTRSALIGMLAAGLGVDRSEHDRLSTLHRDLEVAVRIDHEGRIMRDFLSVQSVHGGSRVKKNYRTYLRSRRRELKELVEKRNKKDPLKTKINTLWYVHSPLYTVAVRSEGDAPPVDDLKEALRDPFYPLYLGRKSCPLGAPPHPQIVESDSLIAALEERDSLLYLCHLTQSDSVESMADSIGIDLSEEVMICWEGEENLDDQWKTSRVDRMINPSVRGFVHREEKRSFVSRPNGR